MSTFNELIDFTRSTTGTYLDSVVYGDEVVTNGDFATDSDWIKTGNLTAISNGTATIGETAGNGSIRQEDALIAGKSYIVKFDITAVSSASAFLAFRNDEFSSVGSAVISFGSSLSAATYSKVFVATGSIVNFTVGGGNSNLTIANVSVKEVTGGQVSGTSLLRTAVINEPRLEYDASGNPLGLLIEEARTNKVAYSQDFTQSYWTKNQLTVAPAPVAAPDGTMTATHAVKAGSNAFLIRLSTVSTTDRHSIWARTVSGTGTMYIGGTDASTLVTVTEEWQRLDVQCNNTNVYAASLRDLATLTEVYIWGSQVETGSFPTSYIPTSGSTVTRAADIASASSFKYHQNSTQGTLYVAFTPNVESLSFKRVAEFGYSSLRFSIQLYNGEIRHYTRNAPNGTNNAIGTSYLYTPYRTQKSAFTVGTGYAAKSDNGTDAQSETDVFGLNESNVGLYIGRSGSGAQLNGHIKQIQYYPKRLSNEELQLLTQPSASPTMNLTFDGQATSTLVEGLHD